MAYELRDKAFRDWCNEAFQPVPELRHLNPTHQDAFNAGWKARKIAQYKGIVE